MTAARELPRTRAAHDAPTKTSHAHAPAPCVLRSLKDNKGGSMTTTNTPRFELSRIFGTPMALAVVKRAGESALGLLKRHPHGDFGDLHDDDVQANELALRRGMRVLSVFVFSTEERVWLITEADRSSTTILLPEEY
jgi:hypothetical protein